MRHNIFETMTPKKPRDEENVFETFLLKKGLYDSIDITENNIDDLIDLLSGERRISAYCKECKAERVFALVPFTYYCCDECRDEYIKKDLSEEVRSLQTMRYSSQSEYRKKNGGEWQWKNWQIDEVARVLVFKYVCGMNDSHHLDYIVLADNKTFRKIGQYPSFADLSFPELDQYTKVMSAEDRREFGRAMGLFASGIGAGSYVYLRRILERLLMQAKTNAGENIDDDIFSSARVGEKITLLKDYLPAMLTSNPAIYGILSKGIHELSERDCIVFFPVLKDCIYMILDEWEDQRKKEEKEKSISTALSKIASQIT